MTVSLEGQATVQCTSMIPSAKVSIGAFHQQMRLHVINIQHDIMLGKPWLARHNPAINWTTNTVTLHHKGQANHPTTTTTSTFADYSTSGDTNPVGNPTQARHTAQGENLPGNRASRGDRRRGRRGRSRPRAG